MAVTQNTRRPVPETGLDQAINLPLLEAASEMERAERNDLARRLNDADAAANAIIDPTARNEAKEAIQDLIAQIRTGRLSPSAISYALANIEQRISNGQVASQTTSAQLSEAMYGSLPPLNAAGRAFVRDYNNAFLANDTQALTRLTVNNFSDEMTTPDDQQFLQGVAQDYFNSDRFRRERTEILQHPQEHVTVTREAMQRARQWGRDWMAANGAEHPAYDAVQDSRRNHLYMHPDYHLFVAAVERGAPDAELRSIMAPMERDIEAAGLRRQRDGGPQRRDLDDQFLRSLSPELRQQASTPEGLETVITTLRNDNEKNDELARWRAANPGNNNVPQHLQPYFLAQRIRAQTAIQSQQEFELQHLRRLEQNIERIRSTPPEQLTEREREYMQNLSFINDPQQDIVARARLLVRTAGADMGAEGAPLNEEEQLGRAIVTLNFADSQPGGLARHAEMMRRFNAARAAGGGSGASSDPEARDYYRAYQNFMQLRLTGENIDRHDATRNLDMLQAMRELGEGVRMEGTGSTQVRVVDGQLRFFNSNSDQYEGTDNFMTSRAALNAQIIGGTGQMVSLMYRAVHDTTPAAARDPRASNLEFVRLIRDIDTYRLQTDPRSQALIESLYRGAPFTPEMRAQVDASINAELRGMQPYAQQVLDRADPYQRELLQRYNLLNADGTLNVPALMQRVGDNKALPEVFTTWRDNTRTPMDQLPNQPLREARAMSELAAQLRAAHSMEHLIERAEEISTLTQRGGVISPSLEADRELYEAILRFDPRTATDAERQAFRDAVGRYMRRDDYIQRKEEADRDFQQRGLPGEMANLVDRTADLIENRLRAEPELFRGGAHDHDHGTAADSHDHLPATGEQQEGRTGAASAPAVRDTAYRSDRREREGSDDFLDDSFSTGLERAMRQVRDGVSTEQWFSTLAPVTDRRFNTQGADYLSINEIEKALLNTRKADGSRVRRVEDIADVNGNGFDIEDIRAHLAQSGVTNPVAATVAEPVQPQAGTPIDLSQVPNAAVRS